MRTKINLLPANYGDCIFLTCDGYNILIDGGTRNTYQDLHDRRSPDKALKKLVEGLKSNQQHIDLMVITHVDDDHIGGILEWFETNYPEEGFIREIWMNDDVVLSDNTSLQNSPKSAGTLINKMKAQGQPFRNDIIVGIEEDRGPFHVKVLAPLPEFRNSVAEKIHANLQNAGNSMETYKKSMKKLVEEDWQSKPISKENRASIALELSVSNDEKMLMLGDANIKDIMDGLDVFYPDKDEKINYAVIKLSHHGSKNNFDPSFIQRVKADIYLVSTNGDKFNHPDKEVIAQIICNTDSSIGFNYQNRIDLLFTEEDKKDFPDLVKRVLATTCSQ